VTRIPTYVIEVNGPLPASLAAELTTFHQHTDHESTTLTGPIADTAVLYGLLARLEMFGIALTSIRLHPTAPKMN
jgi:hypothetical protein